MTMVAARVAGDLEDDDVNDARVAQTRGALGPAVRATRSRGPHGESAGDAPVPAMLGDSRAMRGLRAFIDEAAALDVPVLVTGERGSGKELAARTLHARSSRASGPFVVVNIHALAGELDAALAAARRGTLFLDEIGGMPKGMQLKLLDAIERAPRVRARIVCATITDLHAAVKRGAFRSDLLAHLDVVRVELPPLRERDDDVVVLARHFLEIHAARSGKRVTEFSDAALQMLRVWSWPGNVRELANCIAHAVHGARSGAPVDVDPATAHAHAYADVDDAHGTGTGAGGDASRDDDGDDLIRLDDVVRRHVLKILRMTGGNRRNAAKLLGISRRTLYRRLDEWNLTHDEP